MRYRYHTLDVFTDHVFGGNPLAVFPEASGLDAERMQRVARELNLSETVAQLSAAMPPRVDPAPPAEELAAGLSLSPAELADEPEPAVASCGVPFLVVHLRDREALARARIDPGRWEPYLAERWAGSVYLVAPGEEADLRARMFGPSMGIAEDPAAADVRCAVFPLRPVLSDRRIDLS